MATEKSAPLSLLAGMPEDDPAVKEAKASQEALRAALFNRQQMFDPTLLAMAQGFLAPTRAGSFGESISNVAARVLPVQEEEQKRAIQMAQMRSELAAQELAERQGARRQQLAGQVYRKGETGEFEMDPEAAMRYAQATGDLKFMEQAVGQQKSAGLKKAQEEFFSPKEGGKYAVNPDALRKIFTLGGPQAVEAISKSIPSMRQMGLLEGLTADSPTPFDAVLLMADNLGPQAEAFKAQAERLAKQYRGGYINFDEAEKISKDLFNTANASVDRATALKNTEMQQAMLRGLREEGLAIQRETQKDRQERERREAESKLTDEQKATFNKIVIPIQQEAAKAAPGMAQIEQLRTTVANAPSGTLSGAYASSVGRLFGTDDNTALRKLDSLSKGLIPLIPRLPGAASNLDAMNLEKSIGKLSDITLTNKQRVELLDEIDQGFKRLIDRADAVQRSWESSKSVPVSVLGGERPGAKPPAAGAPAPAPAPATGAPTRAFIGTRAIVVRNNQWVYEDTGKPVER